CDVGDYGAELARLRSDISAAGGAIADVERPTRLAFLLYRRASLTGSTADFGEADAAITDALGQGAPPEPLHLLRSTLDLKQHRIAEARAGLALVDGRFPSPDVLALRGDLAVQAGRYDAARRDYDRALRGQRTWDVLARLA